MCIYHGSLLPQDDPETAPALDRDAAPAGVERPPRGSLAKPVPATVRPGSSPEVERPGLVRRTEVIRKG
jgi:hypothetical protein